MVRITKVHTGIGDRGTTVHLNGETVSKGDVRLEVVGCIDELNCLIGIVRMELKRMPETTLDGGPRTTVLAAQREFDKTLSHLQQELFDLAAECSTTPDSIPDGMQVLSAESCERLVNEMDEWLEEVEPLSSFILPSGNPIVANLHLARAVARRCERRLATLRDNDGDDSIRIISLTYLNRLSDWLFVMCRVITARFGQDEELWKPLGKRNQ